MEEDGAGDFADWELLQTEEITGMVNDSGSCGVSNLGILQTDCLASPSSNDDRIYPIGALSFESSCDRYDDDGKFVDLGGIGALAVISEESVVDELLDSDEMELVSMKSGESESPRVTEIGENVEELEGTTMQMDSGETAAVEALKPTTEEEKRSILWWKVPFNFLNCCAFRFKPIWTLSVVASVMGFVILGRRWHRLKNKSPGLKLKVTTDEKRETRLLNHVVRLNEAFSIVRRIPVIRPSPLPATGVTVTWSRMGLR